MFDKKKLLYICLSTIAIFSISFGIGYMIMDNSIDRNISDNENIDIENSPPNVQIAGEENIITPNTFIEKTTHYKECGHVHTDVNLADDTIVNMTREDYEKYLEDNTNYQLISFSNVKITIREERNHLCTNHYVIGEEDGKIAIFSIDEEGNRVLDRVFEDYHVDVLQEIDREKIINGIVVDSEEELSEILENFIS